MLMFLERSVNLFLQADSSYGEGLIEMDYLQLFT